MAKVLKENEIEIEGKVYEIKPVKMKYMKKGYYSAYMNVHKFQFMQLAGFSDGEPIIMDVLTGAFDSEEKATEVFDLLDTLVIKKIMSIIKKVNELEDEIVPNVETPVE